MSQLQPEEKPMRVRRIIIERLFESFKELDRAIESARKTLERKPNPPKDVLGRINTYQEILNKQRTLASSLCTHASRNNWEEVSRHVKIINGLSAMIRDDAREIVSGIRPETRHVEGQALLV